MMGYDRITCCTCGSAVLRPTLDDPVTNPFAYTWRDRHLLPEHVRQDSGPWAAAPLRAPTRYERLVRRLTGVYPASYKFMRLAHEDAERHAARYGRTAPPCR